MRVLHLISSGGHYGAENMILNLTRFLERLGHRCTLALFCNAHRPNVELGEIAKAEGLPVETIACKGRVDWKAVRAISDSVSRHKIDLVHAHGYKADLYALAAARRNRTPLVSTCHNWIGSSASLRAYQFLDLLCLRHFDMAVAVSANVAALLRRFGVPKDKIATIANGIDLSAFQSARPSLANPIRKGNGLVIGVVAQLTLGKGHEHLLRAVPDILARYPHTVFIFAGDGPARGELEKLVQQLRIGPSVVFLGERRDMPGVYASMDVFVLPSLDEGLPMVILEALAAGKPVVATKVGDITKLILHEETGLLVSPQDVSGLRDAILRLIARPELRQQFAENGQARVALNFSADAMARQYAALYENLSVPKATALAQCINSE